MKTERVKICYGVGSGGVSVVGLGGGCVACNKHLSAALQVPTLRKEVASFLAQTIPFKTLLFTFPYMHDAH